MSGGHCTHWFNDLLLLHRQMARRNGCDEPLAWHGNLFRVVWRYRRHDTGNGPMKLPNLMGRSTMVAAVTAPQA